MADAKNANKQKHNKKDRGYAEVNTARNRAKRIARNERRANKQRVHLFDWASRHGVKASRLVTSRELRFIVAERRAHHG